MEIVKEEKQLDEALANAFKYSRDILVEEFIGGKELTVSMMQKDGEVVALPVIHIAPHSGTYDYHSKYTKGATEYICPADLDDIQKAQRNIFARQIWMKKQPKKCRK